MTPTDVTERLAATHAHPSLREPDRREIVNSLETVLVDLVDLSLVGKQLHWAVVGADFRSLHLQLDEMVDDWRELADAIAERCTALGFVPDGQAEAVARESAIEPVAVGPIHDVHVVRLLAERLAEAVARARKAMDRLGEPDAGSQDAVIEVVRKLEEQLWMIRAQEHAPR